jgi:hypothetical protein
MATAAKPTNERIAEMLLEVRRELGGIKEVQDRLAADVRRFIERSAK